MSNIKIDEILKHDKNYIGTFSKDNALLLKNNQSAIINLQDSDKNGSHWIILGFSRCAQTLVLYSSSAVVNGSHTCKYKHFISSCRMQLWGVRT